MKKLILTAIAILSLTESSFAQSNFILPGETKTFRTGGLRRLTVTCGGGGQSSFGVPTGFFHGKDCNGRIVAVVELNGDLIDDQYTCETNYNGRRDRHNDGVMDGPLGSRFRSFSIDGVCHNFPVGAPDSKWDLKDNDWLGIDACAYASKTIKSSFR